MLFLVEWSGIEAVSNAKEREANIGKPFFGSFAHWIREELYNFRAQRDRRLPHAKELVNEGDKNDKEETNSPGTDRGDWHASIVMRIDYSANFGVGAVGSQQGNFDLSL